MQDHPLGRDTDLSRLEAVLLLAREPVNSRKLAQFANLADGTQARTLVRRLNERYDAAGRAFRVEQVAGGFQLLTRRKFAPWLRRLAHIPGESRLSAPALETLSVIAYRQPVPRADIEAIRGVNCGEILRQLMERDLVRIGGRSEELGRPFLYATTKRFLQVYGLIHLDDLPRGDLLRHAPLPVAGPSVTIFAGPASVELNAEEPAVDEGLAEPDTSGEIRFEIDDE
jgi:segregation and condensation protein B